MKNSYGALTESYHIKAAKSFVDSLVTTPTYAFYAKASPWTSTASVNGISQSNPAVVTSFSHGFKDGDIVSISGVNGMTQINEVGVDQVVANATADTFELYGVNSTLYSTYINGGVITKSLENDFPDVTHAEMDEIAIRREILFMKRINASNAVLVVPLIEWSINKKFYAIDAARQYINQFYCVNNYGDVYICVDNGNGKFSTVEPDNISYEPFTLVDGYTWKYLFSMTVSDLQRARDVGFMRVRRLEFDNNTSQWLVQKTSIPGQILRVSVESAGYSYRIGDVVTAEGDGSGFSGRVSQIGIGGTIYSVEVLNPGKLYTNAILSVTSISGTSSTLRAVISNGEGLGANAERDLTANKVMITASFERDESGKASTSVKVRKMGLAQNMRLESGEDATDVMYDLRTRVVATSSSSSLPKTGYVVSDNFNGYITEVTGTPASHTIYFSEISPNVKAGDAFQIGSYQGTVSQVFKPTVNVLSGDIIYTENRSPLTRSSTSTETLNIVLAF